MRRQIESNEQREGRGVRQGNQNPRDRRSTATPSRARFDAYSWQTVERKARFINQVMRGRLDVREIEDIGENTLCFAEVKALASGDPLILEQGPRRRRGHPPGAPRARLAAKPAQPLRDTIATATATAPARSTAIDQVVTDALSRSADDARRAVRDDNRRPAVTERPPAAARPARRAARPDLPAARAAPGIGELGGLRSTPSSPPTGATGTLRLS